MSRQTPSLSFEVFPPNPEVGNDKIIAALKDMQGLAPHFISVTASNNKFNIKETYGSFGRLYPKMTWRSQPSRTCQLSIWLRIRWLRPLRIWIKLVFRKSWLCVGISFQVLSLKKISVTPQTWLSLSLNRRHILILLELVTQKGTRIRQTKSQISKISREK